MSNPFYTENKDVFQLHDDDNNILSLCTTSQAFFTRFKLSDLLWQKNRSIDTGKVSEIEENIQHVLELGRSFPNKQVTIGTVSGRNPVIIDGQHRCHAFKLFDRLKFRIQLIDYQSNEERFEGFKDINSNTALPEYYKDPDSLYKNIANRLVSSLDATSENGNLTLELKKDAMRTEIYDIMMQHRGSFEDCDLVRYIDMKVDHVMKKVSKIERWVEACKFSGDALIPVQPGKCVCLKTKTGTMQCKHASKFSYNNKGSEKNRCGKHVDKTYLYNPKVHSDGVYDGLEPEDRYLIYQKCGWFRVALESLDTFLAITL